LFRCSSICPLTQRSSSKNNNPLSGKDIDYDFKILKKIEDTKEKVSALQDYFFKQTFEFEINEKNKKIIFKDEKLKPLIDMMNQKFKEMIGFSFEIKEESKKAPKKENTKKQQ